jgi:hypothetical protein
MRTNEFCPELTRSPNQVSASILIEKVTIFGRNQVFCVILQSSSEDFSFETGV